MQAQLKAFEVKLGEMIDKVEKPSDRHYIKKAINKMHETSKDLKFALVGIEAKK